MSQSERPLIVAGQGIRLAGGIESLEYLLGKTGIPVSTSFNGCDLLPTDHPNYVGRIGNFGERSGNFCIKNADFLLTIGTRNNYRQTGFNRSDYARSAYKVVVDIDPAELMKPGISPDLSIESDAAEFLDAFLKKLNNIGVDKERWKKWRDWCTSCRRRYSTVLPEYESADEGVQPYYLIRRLTEKITADTTVVTGNGTAYLVMMQAGVVKFRQRVISNSGCASMGYDIPAAIGAALGGKKEVLCLTGDGSVMMNIQELATLRYLNLPVKLFILCNSGYISIRQTQDTFFGKPHVACGPESGVTFPDFEEVAKSFGLPVFALKNHDGIDAVFHQVMSVKGPAVCVVQLLNDYAFSPRSSSQRLPDGTIASKPLEDMFPFLERSEYRKNFYENTDKELGE